MLIHLRLTGEQTITPHIADRYELHFLIWQKVRHYAAAPPAMAYRRQNKPFAGRN
jgi:hypothetical protein